MERRERRHWRGRQKDINSGYFWIVGFQEHECDFSISYTFFCKNKMDIYYFEINENPPV